jgi:hypothetical protein
LLTTSTSGAQTAGITTWALHTVKEALVLFPSARDEGQANGMALCVGAVEFLDRLVCVFKVLVCNVGHAFGASSAVVDEGKVGNGADFAKEILLFAMIVRKQTFRMIPV